MKKYLLILLSMLMILICCSCNSNDDEVPIDGGVDDHMDIFTGKVVEIKDDNTVLIQITEERGGYKVDDKVYVHYDEAEVLRDPNDSGDYNIGENLEQGYKPVIGDEICVQADPYDSKKMDGYDYRESTIPISKYVTIDESSESSSKE